MAGERVKLIVKERTVLGSPESRRMRKRGLIPGILYGRETPVPISIEERALRAALTTSAGTHAVLDVTVDGGASHSAVLKEYQQDRVRGTIIHIDLQEVRLDQPIQSSVAVTLVGEPAGVKMGGVLSQPTTEVNVEALPLEMPQHLDFDVSAMEIGDTARLADLQVPANVTLLDDLDETVIATVAQPMREEAAEEGEEAEAAAEGEQAPESETEAPAEPDAPAAGGEGTVEG